jgi:hypothetical protein
LKGSAFFGQPTDQSAHGDTQIVLRFRNGVVEST